MAVFLGIAFWAISQIICLVSFMFPSKPTMVVSTYLFLACVFAIGYHSVSTGGLLKDSTGVVRRLAANSSISLQEIGTKDLRRKLDSNLGEIMLVDSRFRFTFESGTIANAINYPLDVDANSERQILEKLNSCTEIIVFCESAGCTFSDKIAHRIVNAGNPNVIVYRPGYREWNKSEK